MSDEEVAVLMSEALQEIMGAGFDGEDTVTDFAEYLESCRSEEGLGEEPNVSIADLVGDLNQLSIEAGGGDRKARECMRAVHDLLNSALDDEALAPIDLIMTGKLFHDAGWTVPDRLKEAVRQALQSETGQSGTGVSPPVAIADLSSQLLELAEDGENNPFDICEFVSSVMAAFPSETCGPFFDALAALRRPEVNHALAGFLVHPDAIVAGAATGALSALAGHTEVESLLIERLVLMRSWLSPARQDHIDTAIKALRPHAAPPQKRALPEITGCYVSVCDGAGVRSVSVSVKQRTRYMLASVMIKPSGVADVVVMPGLSKSDMRRLLGQLNAAVPASRADVASVARMLSLALADNATAATVPPFRLVQVVESLGLPPLHADHATPSEIVAELLAGLPEEQVNEAAAAKAHDDLLGVEFIERWFEAGEALDDLLHPLKGFDQRAEAVLTTYLPRRRQFWARQCAMSALALRAEPGDSSWKQLALVGRDLASDLPLEHIPLMKQVAATSVHAFESQS